uniref:Uncharacterized protein n=1 Tax=Sphaerodactylus townsendi TaxID=933632 RepID=A0ACB8F6N2_9SAUR
MEPSGRFLLWFLSVWEGVSWQADSNLCLRFKSSGTMDAIFSPHRKLLAVSSSREDPLSPQGSHPEQRRAKREVPRRQPGKGNSRAKKKALLLETHESGGNSQQEHWQCLQHQRHLQGAAGGSCATANGKRGSQIGSLQAPQGAEETNASSPEPAQSIASAPEGAAEGTGPEQANATEDPQRSLQHRQDRDGGGGDFFFSPF